MSSRYTLANVLSRRAEQRLLTYSDPASGADGESFLPTSIHADSFPASYPSAPGLPRALTQDPAALAKYMLEHNERTTRAAASVLVDRLRFAKTVFQQFDNKRDFWRVLGYKKSLEFEDFQDQYERGDIASRIIDIPAEETWFAFPRVVDADGPNGAFAKAWKKLQRKLNLPEVFTRLDRAAGIGSYGCALIGLRGNNNLESPLRENSVRDPEDVLYVSVFSEATAKFGEPVVDPSNERYGKPEFYQIDFTRGAGTGGKSPVKQSGGQTTKDVHASRIIHLAEGRLESDLYGVPRLQPVFNRLYDLAKTVGGSAETFWQVANKGLHANVDPNMVGRIKQADLDRLKDDIELYRDQITRVIRTTGVDLKDLGSDVVNPRGVFAVVAAVIAGTTKIPYRMLFATERGAATSIYDRTAFREEVILPRQTRVAEPQVVRPFVDMLIFVGALPKPKEEEYDVLWPDPIARSRADQAKISVDRASAAASLAKALKDAREAGVNLLSREQQLTILGIDPSEAEAEDISEDPTGDPDTPSTPDGDDDDAQPPTPDGDTPNDDELDGLDDLDDLDFDD